VDVLSDSQSESPPGGTNAPGRWSGRTGFKLGLLFFSLIIVLLPCELALRWFCPSLAPARDELSLTYSYDAELGWFPQPNSHKQVTGSRTISATHNRYGFRGPEPARSEKMGIVFLGDSLVWGFDVESNERFTEQLQNTHKEWQVYNLGVSGYGTDQEYLLLQKYFDLFHPRGVILVICGDNDNEDNAWNFRGGYYKPFYTLEQGRLKLNGVPVPHSEKTFFAAHTALCRPFLIRLAVRAWFKLASPPPKRVEPLTGAILLDMRKFVAEKNAFFGVGLQHAHPDLQKFLDQYKIPYVDLTTTNASHVYSGFGSHWTPEGHRFVTEKLEKFITSH
jgi:hypothetical protein